MAAEVFIKQVLSIQILVSVKSQIVTSLKFIHVDYYY